MERDLPAAFRLLAIPATVFCLVLFVAPLILMLSLAVSDPEPGWQNFGWLATTPAVGKIVSATLRFSAGAAAIAVILGFLLAYVIWLADRGTSVVLLAVVLVSFWLSVLVRCFALIMVLGPRGPLNGVLDTVGVGLIQLIRNETGVLIGMVHYLIPFAVITIGTGLRSIDPALIAASRSMGAGRGRILRTIILPLAAPAVVAAFALTFVVALGFYVTPALLGGGRVVMIAEFITFFVQKVLAWGKASSLALLLIAIIGASYGLARLLELALRRRRAA